METVLFMIRHAQSPFVFGKERTRKLSEQGEHDAKAITEIMRKVKVDIIVSSPYSRAIQTIENIAIEKRLKMQFFEELKERPIKGEYKLPKKDLLKAIKKSYDDKDYCLPGGETMRQAQERALPVISQLLNEYKGKNIIIGTHGNIMTIIMNYFDQQYGYKFWKGTSKPDIYKLSFNENKLSDVERLWEPTHFTQD
ncbi:histidine phosphatase family protein [Lederbergia lenta]|uniref:Phosphoglycerate mutase n=1 Tax=Lederbergia lenta TaxID=1467 RepID=A0A2X4W413_LEDLE|nr:histidine phosphatase family protein [Lederbergia lenta]MEC2324649.1 histidine phosphatase family protein [Lederbergia lenta]SQI58906.1 phosphoglycerate mutase [Lederbergia lenta]